jgi:hypothetical protein
MTSSELDRMFQFHKPASVEAHDKAAPQTIAKPEEEPRSAAPHRPTTDQPLRER